MARLSKNILICLILVLVCGTGIRFFQLGDIPRGVYSDEAMNAYNAYSLFHTGKDVAGRLLPSMVTHFDTKIEGMYAYLTAPVVGLFGLSPFTARFVAAFIGSLTILIVFCVGREMKNEKMGIFAALLIALLPLHIHYSKIAFRAILAPLLMLMVIYFLLRARKEQRMYVYAAVCSALSLYTYPVTKLLVPCILVWYVLCAAPKKFSFSDVSVACVVLVVLSLPVILGSIGGDSDHRFSQVSILSQEGAAEKLFERIAMHFNPSTLLMKEDSNRRHGPLGFGVLPPLFAILMACGIYYAYVRKDTTVGGMVALFVVSFIPSIITQHEGIHFTRMIGTIPWVVLLSAYGAYSLLESEEKKFRLPLLCAIMLGALFTGGHFVHSYYVDYPAQSESWFYAGVAQSYDYVYDQNPDGYVILTTSDLDGAFALPLFYGKVEPEEYFAGEHISHICPADIENCYLENEGIYYIVRTHELLGKPHLTKIQDSTGNSQFRIVKS